VHALWCLKWVLYRNWPVTLMFNMFYLLSQIISGVDSFYEYLLKAHILFGKEDFWRMFHSAYVAVQKHFRLGPWYHFNCKETHVCFTSMLIQYLKIESYWQKYDRRYHEADMRTGRATYWQLTSLQSFWLGLQASSWTSNTYYKFCLISFWVCVWLM
jgi:mannosidase alpha-like ER degradation enhancer 1